MRWFASYWITVILCLVGAGIYWLIGHDVRPFSDWLDWLVPLDAPPLWLIPAMVVACYTVVRALVHRVLAYTESAIDASPRADGLRGQRRAAIGNSAYATFGNATGWWLAPFATTLALAVAFMSVVRWGVGTVDRWTPGGPDLLISLLLALAVLYSITVGSAMFFPDRPQPLLPAPDPEPDPVLAIPEPPPVIPARAPRMKPAKAEPRVKVAGMLGRLAPRRRPNAPLVSTPTPQPTEPRPDESAEESTVHSADASTT